MSRALVAGALVLVLGLGGCAGSGDRSVRSVAEYDASTQGRTITTRFIGDEGPSILVIGGIHGSEPEGLLPARSLVRWLETEPTMARFVIVEDLNPDGSAVLARTNARGVDLNRNWPASNFRASSTNGSMPLSEAETRLGDDLVRRVEPVLVIVLHSISTCRRRSRRCSRR